MGTEVASEATRTIPALRFKQWLADWEEYNFDEAALRRKPPQYMYMFTMRAAELRKLSDVYRRQREGANVEGIQRLRDVTRTGRIQRYVKYGYPYGDLGLPQRTEDALPLRKPGWLPTAIVINMLVKGDMRRNKTIGEAATIKIKQLNEQFFEIVVPSRETFDDGDLAPFEVIDGQHRLWAFDDADSQEAVPDDFELPVVAYHGLDVAWQAYLFWSINVSPKRINPSHAFDLYPLLRTQDWLDRVGELTVYREARAQELAELMYSHPLSPWHHRINMLGERGAGGVSQATWVRALLSTFLSTGRGHGRAGLFQANLSYTHEPLQWSRAQQAAFIMRIWIDLKEQIAKSTHEWWIRKYDANPDRAFSDKTSMLNQDQGVRAVLSVANDLFYHSAEIWQLDRWMLGSQNETALLPEEVDYAISSLNSTPFSRRIAELAEGLVLFDWRSLDGPEVKKEEGLEVQKRSYRGSGGYAALREDVLAAIHSGGGEVGRAAGSLLSEAAE